MTMTSNSNSASLRTDSEKIKQTDSDPVTLSKVRSHPDDSQQTLAYSTDIETSDIVYHYLTFDTKLPHLSSLYPHSHKEHDASTSSPPEPPDLTAFMNPFEWSEKRKTNIIYLSCIATLFTAYAAGCYSSGIGQLEAHFDISAPVATLGITIFTAGFAIAPMILAPLSEINGRRPLFLVTGGLFFVFVIITACTPTFAGLLVARFLEGAASSTFSSTVGGVVADIYEAKDRNTPMTLFTGAALFGTGLGPLVSGFIAENVNWRWIFWVHAITIGILFIMIIIVFKETRGSVLLSRKAKKLNKYYKQCEDQGYYGFDVLINNTPTPQRIRWKVKADEERASLKIMIFTSCYRPFALLLLDPTVFFFSLWISFSWAILYMLFGIIPYAFSTIYEFSLQQQGAVFTSVSVASLLATVLSIVQEKIATRRNKLNPSPEGRLTFACYESALLPLGLFIFGWTAQPGIHWVVPAIALGVATIGIFFIYLAVFLYLADTYGRFASSAIAAQSFCRNLLGGAFPLFTKRLFDVMATPGVGGRGGARFGGASSFLGGVGCLLTIVPWVLVLYGPKIRAKSRFASALT